MPFSPSFGKTREVKVPSPLFTKFRWSWGPQNVQAYLIHFFQSQRTGRAIFFAERDAAGAAVDRDFIGCWIDGDAEAFLLVSVFAEVDRHRCLFRQVQRQLHFIAVACFSFEGFFAFKGPLFGNGFAGA